MRLFLPTLAAMIVLTVGLSMTPAFAHARLDSSVPTKGEILAVGPAEIEITFTQEIQKLSGSYDITVEKDRGPSVTVGPAVVEDTDRTKLSVSLQASLDDGRYVVNWKNVSDADGDPAEGAFSFYLNYLPNTVDLANDAQLEQVGFEAEETPSVSDTATVAPNETLVTGITTVAETPGTSASPTPVSSSSDGGGSSTPLLILAGVMAAVVAIAGAAFVLMRRR